MVGELIFKIFGKMVRELIFQNVLNFMAAPRRLPRSAQ